MGDAMPFEYTSVEEAMARRGLRMIVVGDIPSPWGEAAKGVLHIENIPWVAVRLSYDSPVLKKWAGQRSGPVAIYDDERPRSGWSEILQLAERLAPRPSLLPVDPAPRATVFGLVHELAGEGGLGWSRRLQSVHAGLNGTGGFPKPVAEYIGKKYGYRPEAGERARERVVALLGMFAARLRSQQQVGSDYYVGEELTAVDVYGAAFMAMFGPLPARWCTMNPVTRGVFETVDDVTAAALDPILFEHRDRMYAQHLELPLSL